MAPSDKPRTVTDEHRGTDVVPDDPRREQADPDACGHANQMWLRLIDYTPYGEWIGCVECGTSWLIRDPS